MMVCNSRNIPRGVVYVCVLGNTYFFWRSSPKWARASSFTRFLDHTQRRTTVGMTPLDEWSARRRDLYLTTHNIHNRRTFMPPVGFEPITHNDKPQSIGLLWTSDQLVAETSTWQHTTFTTDRHSCPQWNSNPSHTTTHHSR